jgi:hypothetical protein
MKDSMVRKEGNPQFNFSISTQITRTKIQDRKHFEGFHKKKKIHKVED